MSSIPSIPTSLFPSFCSLSVNIGSGRQGEVVLGEYEDPIETREFTERLVVYLLLHGRPPRQCVA